MPCRNFWRRIVALFCVVTLTVFAAGCSIDVADSIETARRLSNDVVTRSVTSEEAASQPDPPFPFPADLQPVLDALQDLEVSPRGSSVKYARDDWRHWIDADRDCQNTRAEVLVTESVAPVSFAPENDGDQCRVISGQWVGPWTGEVFTDASDVDIDHHVPLGHAHESGGWRWDAERKRAYANDLTHPASLQATSAPVNRSKGKQPPDEWRPDEAASWCRYAADWITVKQRWDLTVTSYEVVVLEDMLATCDNTSSWGLSGARGR